MTEQMYDTYFEECLLGVMLSFNEVIDDILNKVTPEFFYDLYNRHLFEKICSQWKVNGKVDLITVSNEEPSDKTGRIANLTSLVSSSSWEVFANKLEKCKEARIIPTEIKNLFEDVTPMNIDEKVETLKTIVSNHNGNSVVGKSARDIVISNITAVDQAKKRTSLYNGFESGFEKLDKVIEGWQPKTFYIIGARPSVGKTAFALSLITKLAKNKVKCSLFSLEMTSESLGFRILSAESGIPMKQLKSGLLGDNNNMINRYMNASRVVSELPISFFDQEINFEKKLISTIVSETKKGSKVIMIDHLGLVKIANSTGQRYLDLGNLTDTLHQLCKQLDICIILLAQCGREAEGKVPNLALLRESGDIEQNADVIMLLYRKRETETVEEHDPLRQVPIDVIVAKNRDGETGTVPFSFQPALMRFREDSNRSAMNDEGKIEYKKVSEEKQNEIPF